jgi:hypothetical protein
MWSARLRKRPLTPSLLAISSSQFVNQFPTMNSNLFLSSGRRPLVSLAALLLLAAASQTTARAETAFFNFDSGIGSAFTTENSQNLWTLDTDGPAFRVSKSADDGSVAPNEFIFGGIHSEFALLGNFTVTVDFTHNNFPFAGPNSIALNESALSVSGTTPELSLSVLRYSTATASRLEAYSSAPIGDRDSSLSAGRYRIERSGSTLTGSFAALGSDTFTTLGSVSGVTSSQFTVGLTAVQGANSGPRSTTALDITFDNLSIQADAIVPVPEPSVFLLSTTGVIAFVALRRRTK